MTAQSIRNTQGLFLISLLAITVLVAGGCSSPRLLPREPFSRGIRIHQDETLTQNGVKVPLPGCPGGAEWLGQVGGPSPNSGGKIAFLGHTDRFGDIDEPDALDNANWEVFSGPAQSPPCPQAFTQRYVPQGGAVFNFICRIVA
jgi:hypothetical protein